MVVRFDRAGGNVFSTSQEENVGGVKINFVDRGKFFYLDIDQIGFSLQFIMGSVGFLKLVYMRWWVLGDVDKDWEAGRGETQDHLPGGAEEMVGSGPGRVGGGGCWFSVVLRGQAGGCGWVV